MKNWKVTKEEEDSGKKDTKKVYTNTLEIQTLSWVVHTGVEELPHATSRNALISKSHVRKFCLGRLVANKETRASTVKKKKVTRTVYLVRQRRFQHCLLVILLLATVRNHERIAGPEHLLSTVSHRFYFHPSEFFFLTPCSHKISHRGYHSVTTRWIISC